jgi:uncharacterized protein YbaP (TraB family)
MRKPLLALTLLLWPFAAHAECIGTNLIDALPPAERTLLEQRANAVPFSQGNIWFATKGDARITLVGTYHLNDPRHRATVKDLREDLAASSVLLVEAGPDEEAALKQMLAADPGRLLNQNGPTLPEALPQPVWAQLSDAMRTRDIPPVFAAKMQPWYVATLLAVPACHFTEVAAAQGLDKLLIASATGKGIPIKGLEPFDTLFTVFDQIPLADQIEMLMETLGTAGDLEADMAVTLSDSYFRGENQLFWEFSRQQMLDLPGAQPEMVARQFDLVQSLLMTDRNRKWLPVIEQATAKGPVFVAVGALHLPGEAGLLNLLTQDGWVVEPW